MTPVGLVASKAEMFHSCNINVEFRPCGMSYGEIKLDRFDGAVNHVDRADGSSLVLIVILVEF